MLDRIKKDKKLMLAIFLIFAVISALIGLIKLGLTLSLLIIILLWLILFLLFFINIRIEYFALTALSVLVVFSMSLLISFRVINFSDASSGGITLSPCTKTASDTIAPLSGWKTTIYSAPLRDSSPEPTEANNIKTFSMSKIKDKTADNSLYARTEKSDGSTIEGHGIEIEVCDTNNMATKYHTTAESNHKAGEGITASISYFHGANYLHSIGEYRVDVFIEDGGKWHLVDRMTGIEITE